MIDIHCHILPGVDDGAKDMGISVEMLKIAQQDGIKTIIATPHYNNTYYDVNFNTVENYAAELKMKAVENNIDIDILPGQEINIKRPVLELYSEGVIGCLNRTKYMLLELDFEKFEHDDIDIIYELKLRGVVPIIAHPERYDYIINKPSLVNSLLNEGCLFQINQSSISGLFGREVKNTANTLMKHGICNFIASDAHSAGRRSPRLREVYGSFDADLSKKLIKNVEDLVENKEIYSQYERIKEKRSIFNIFKR